GVGDRTVSAGQTAAIDMDCRDPDATTTSIASGPLPPSATFDQTTGNPSSGRYRQPTNTGQAGQRFGVSFTCTDSGTPPEASSRGATIHIVADVVPTPVPTARPTPRQCRAIQSDCTAASQCCTNHCEFGSQEARICCALPGE